MASFKKCKFYSEELEENCRIMSKHRSGYCDYHYIQDLEDKIFTLSNNLKCCKNDYWFMINLLERYSSDKEQAIKDCIERMKFRKPLFNVLEDLK